MNEITTESLTSFLPVAVAEVLETMFFAPVEPSCSVDNPINDSWLTVAVDFTGKPSGSTWIWLEKDTARSLAADFLGIDAGEIESELIEQTVCELGNMICGSIVSRVESHSAFTLAPPRMEPAMSYAGPAPVRFQLDRGELAVACRLLSV